MVNIIIKSKWMYCVLPENISISVRVQKRPSQLVASPTAYPGTASSIQGWPGSILSRRLIME